MSAQYYNNLVVDETTTGIMEAMRQLGESNLEEIFFGPFDPQLQATSGLHTAFVADETSNENVLAEGSNEDLPPSPHEEPSLADQDPDVAPIGDQTSKEHRPLDNKNGTLPQPPYGDPANPASSSTTRKRKREREKKIRESTKGKPNIFYHQLERAYIIWAVKLWGTSWKKIAAGMTAWLHEHHHQVVVTNRLPYRKKEAINCHWLRVLKRGDEFDEEEEENALVFKELDGLYPEKKISGNTVENHLEEL